MNWWQKTFHDLKILKFAIPLLIGALLAVSINLYYGTYPILHLQMDLGTLAFIAGFGTSVLIFWLDHRNQRQKKHVAALLDAEHEEHKQFLLRLDHELKNPLSAIRTGLAYSSQLLMDETITDDRSDKQELQHTITQVDNQTQRISRLISDLRKLAELETCPIEATPVDIHQLVEQIVAEIGTNPAAKERKISVSLPSAPWRLPEIKADEDLLYLTLRNLLDNAIKYTHDKDCIDVRAYENRDHVFIEVADSGIGIPEDEIHQVWNKLYRAKNSRSMPGHGLGLSMVQTVVRRMSGECDLRSRDGQGTVFTIQLPKQSD